MEEARARIRKFGKIVQVFTIIMKVICILGIVVGGILTFAPLFTPDSIRELAVGMEDNDFLLTSVLYNLLEDVEMRCRFMIAGASLMIGFGILVFALTRVSRILRDITGNDTPFTREITEKMKKLSWMMLSLVVTGFLPAIIAFFLMRFLAYIFEYGTFIQDRANETSRIQEEMILSFAEITENKSEQTGKHVRRVAEYTRILAEEMGMEKEEAQKLRLASTMHDVGKLLVPAEILEKPARLSDEEFTEIKKHPVYGGQLLNNVEGEVMHMARTVAMEHHERPDGHGYPKGKTDTDISMEGKIVAVADVYDALTSRRSYKQAWDEKDAYAEILKGKGTQFDTAVVEAFERAYPKINETRIRLQDT